MYAIIDLETTGKTTFNEIIEIACIFAYENDGQIVEHSRYLSKLKPQSEMAWDIGAESIHGYTWEESQQFPDQSKVFKEWVNLLNILSRNEYLTFVCHALQFANSGDMFDRNMLYDWYLRNGNEDLFYEHFLRHEHISTIHRKRSQAHRCFDITSQGLATWAEKLNLTFNHHSAMDDAEMCLEVLNYQYRMGLIQQGDEDVIYPPQPKAVNQLELF